MRPRSGLALRSGITVLSSPGTIDSDYRGEVGVLLVNLGERPFTVTRGDRIAQLVLARCERVTLAGAEGVACGGGYYSIALLILTVLKHLERRIEASHGPNAGTAPPPARENRS